MFQIEHDGDRAIVMEELAAWTAERRRLLLRLDAQMGMQAALGRCNEEAVARFTAGLEECAFQVQYYEAILAAAQGVERAPPPRTNGVHAATG